MQVTATSPPYDPRIPAGVLRLDYVSGLDGASDWALVWPGEITGLWIVVIHGHGSSGDLIFTRKDIRELWLPQFRACGAGLLSVNLRGNAWMGPAAAHDLHDLVNYMRVERGLKRTLFCSGSMGGTSNLIYGVLHPEDVDGIVARGAATDLTTYQPWCAQHERPILREIAAAIADAYGGTPVERPDVYLRHSVVANARRLSMPVALSHGGDDQVIPVSQSRALVAELSDLATFRYDEIPGGNHDSPLHETAGFLWVLEQMSIENGGGDDRCDRSPDGTASHI